MMGCAEMITAMVRFCVFGENQIFICFCLFTSGWEFASVAPMRPDAEWCAGSPVRNHIVFYLKQTLASFFPPPSPDSLICLFV